MKTIKEWFNDLPEDVREKALKNTNEAVLKQKSINLKMALLGAFTWEFSPEGYEYWKSIHESI